MAQGCVGVELKGIVLSLAVTFTPLVWAEDGAVAAGHPLATQVGIAMLKQGGNAFDAAVATSFALSVVEPEASGLGGGAFAVLYAARQKQARVLDFREVAPRRVNPKMYLNSQGQPDTSLSQDGILAGAVPGQVRGLILLQRTYGKLSLTQVMTPAIQLAQRGFPVSERLHQQLEKNQTRLIRQKATAQIWYPSGQVPPTGSRLKQLDLARTLEAIRVTRGESFYTGTTSRLWVKFNQQAQGIITAQDLKDYRPIWREPLVGLYRDYTLVVMPPPSSGGVHLIQMLNILGLRDLKTMTVPDRTLYMAETMKRAYADRSLFLGDPAFVPVPVESLVDLSYARRLATTIGATSTPSSQITPGALLDPVARAQFQAWEQRESQDTSHLSVMDSSGNAIALTQTINGPFGAGLVVPGTGVLLNNEMDDFALAPGVPNLFGLVGGAANAIRPLKRPLSSMTPTLVFKAGRPWLTLGSPGGSFIITAVLQTLVNVVDLDLPLQAAVNAPRFHHQWQPDQLFLESGLEAPVGYAVRPVKAMGSVQAVQWEPLSIQKFQAAADPRREGTAQIFVR